MTWWPFITREHHAEVVAGKDALIRSLDAQNAVLAERLAEPVAVAVSVKLPDDFAIAQPALVRRPRIREERPDQGSPLNYANVDENDDVAIAKIVAQELNGNTTPWLMARKVASIKAQIRTAKRKRAAEQLTAGRVATIRAPGDEDSEYVPSFIQNLIAEAEGA